MIQCPAPSDKQQINQPIGVGSGKQIAAHRRSNGKPGGMMSKNCKFMQ
jgi:hypothetical protein